MEFQHLCPLSLASSVVAEKAKMLGSVVRVRPGPCSNRTLLLRAKNAGPFLCCPHHIVSQSQDFRDLCTGGLGALAYDFFLVCYLFILVCHFCEASADLLIIIFFSLDLWTSIDYLKRKPFVVTVIFHFGQEKRQCLLGVGTDWAGIKENKFLWKSYNYFKSTRVAKI